MSFEKKVTFAKESLILKKIAEFSDIIRINAYVVGGYVRDFLLSRESKDIDIVIEGDGIFFATNFAEYVGVKKPSIFQKFGTAQIKFQNTEVEFVSARKESYTKESIKPIVEKGTLKDDIFRRDFTINTLAIKLSLKEAQLPIRESILDLTGLGIEDLLSRQIIRTPLDPEITFSDDPTRMMRAVRFATKLNFTIEKNTKHAMTEMASDIKRVPIERIRDEFSKMLITKRPSIGIYIMRETTLLQILFPEIELLFHTPQDPRYHLYNVGVHALKALDYSNNDLIIRLAVLLHDIGKPEVMKQEGEKITFLLHEKSTTPELILRRLKYGNETTLKVKELISLHMRPLYIAQNFTERAIRRLIYASGGLIQELMNVAEADLYGQFESIPPYFKKFKDYFLTYDEVQLNRILKVKSPLSGNDIIEVLGYPSPHTVSNWNRVYGTKIGQLKQLIIDNIIAQHIDNTKEAARRYLLSLPKSVLYPTID
jgi:poly(A) polymerase